LSYTDYAREMLIALYFQAEELDAPSTLGDLAASNGIESKLKWAQMLATEWEQQGLADVRKHLGDPSTWQVEISARGMRDVEGPLGDLLERRRQQRASRSAQENVLLTEEGDPLTIEDGDYILLEEESAGSSNSGPTISSETWTGIRNRFERDPQAIENLKGQINHLNRSIEALGLSNHEHAKVQAITGALVKLVESPEPEWKVIVDLLQSPTLNAILGLTGIAQLILKFIFGVG
jgi:hypothetical protein